MTKTFVYTPRIEIKQPLATVWTDISPSVTAVDIQLTAKELAVTVITVLERAVEINRNIGHDLACNDTIVVAGVDVSHHCSRYDLVSEVGERRTVKLYLLLDSDVLRIGGGSFWDN